MTTDNPTAVPPRGGARRGSGSNVPPRGGANRQGKQTSFRARRRRRNQLLAAGGVVALVAIVIAVVVAVGLSSSSSSGPTGSTPVQSAQLTGIDSISPATMAQAEANAATKVANPPIDVSGGSGTVSLTSNGKPEVLYIGANYCPYCAGERWALVMALSKFGTWSNLSSITSAADDNPASIPSFTFVGSSYSSSLIDFQSVETQTVDRKPLQKLSSDQQALLQKYDGPPYVPAQSAGGIPFIDFGNLAVQDGLGFNDTAMQHQSFASIADQVAHQSSPTAGAIYAEAGALVSNICKLTGGKDAVGGTACQAFPNAITQKPAGS